MSLQTGGRPLVCCQCTYARPVPRERALEWRSGAIGSGLAPGEARSGAWRTFALTPSARGLPCARDAAASRSAIVPERFSREARAPQLYVDETPALPDRKSVV